MIKITDGAAEKIKTLIRPGQGLRIAVAGGGCSGFQYRLAFESEEGESDQIIESNGIKLMIDAKSCLYLDGVSLDYIDGLMGAGFKIENPNAKSTCGCGESFSA